VKQLTSKKRMRKAQCSICSTSQYWCTTIVLYSKLKIPLIFCCLYHHWNQMRLICKTEIHNSPYEDFKEHETSSQDL